MDGSLRYPWDTDPAPAASPAVPEPAPPPPETARPPPAPMTRAAAAEPPVWRYHHLTVSGPAAAVGDFAAAARGAGVIPWRLDFARIEEDIFNLAAAQPAERRHLTIAGCRILARQFRERVEAHQARAVGAGRAQPGLPVRSARAAAGAGRHSARSARPIRRHWPGWRPIGARTDRLRQVSERPRRRPAGACRPATRSSATASSPPARRRRRRSPGWRRAGRRCTSRCSRGRPD